MVNKGQIHKELKKFFRISSNLIKSNDKIMIEIRQFDILRKRISKTNPQNKKITEFGFDLAEKSSNEQR